MPAGGRASRRDSADLDEPGEPAGVLPGDWNPGANGRAVPAGARKSQPAAERVDSIAEAAQPATALGARSAYAVVGDGDLSPTVVAVQRHLHGARLGVLGDVRQRLSGDEVQRRLVSGRQAPIEVRIE